ncbi:MAG: threonine synthase [Gemmatimonadales bacterium]
MTLPWSLHCSSCAASSSPDGLPTVCPDCRSPWLVRYNELPPFQRRSDLAGAVGNMWRYREWLPLATNEEPVTLGEGWTPLLELRRLASGIGIRQLLLKDESQNPTGSFKARGLSAAVTRAVAAGATELVVPTAGNAGVALSAYGRRAGVNVKVFAPATTPRRILQQIQVLGAQLSVIDGHIGDCGRAAREYTREHGAFDVSTLREPYRIEGKKTLGLELAEQLDWDLPDAVVYPTGGGTGLIGMWKAFNELRDAGWIDTKPPKLITVQSAGCAPVVRAVEKGEEQTRPWEDPRTVAWGLRVPAPLGGRLILRAIRETGGTAVAVEDDALTGAARRLVESEGIDAGPEGGAALAALEVLIAKGTIGGDARVVIFNTGAGWLYRYD